MVNVGCKCIVSVSLQSSMNMYGDILGLAADYKKWNKLMVGLCVF